MASLTASIEEVIAEVDKWFDERLRRGPIAFEVSCYNQAYKAAQDLRERLHLLLTGNPLPVPTPPAVATETAADPTTPEAAAEEPVKSKSKPAA